MRSCRFCAAPLRHPTAVQCGAPACRRALKAANMRKAKRAVKAVTWVTRDCANCGRSISMDRRTDAKFCSRKCVDANRDRSDYQRSYAARRSELQNARRAANPAQEAGYRAQRRGLEKVAQEGLRPITSKEWESVLRHWDHRCAYCHQDRQLTMDHVVPISRGGKHSIGNLVPACKSCNSAKRDKFISEWKAGVVRKRVRRAVHSSV
jgi:5-methylcytosine-specific restriction endonuclease McrA